MRCRCQTPCAGTASTPSWPGKPPGGPGEEGSQPWTGPSRLCPGSPVGQQSPTACSPHPVQPRVDPRRWDVRPCADPCAGSRLRRAPTARRGAGSCHRRSCAGWEHPEGPRKGRPEIPARAGVLSGNRQPLLGHEKFPASQPAPTPGWPRACAVGPSAAGPHSRQSRCVKSLPGQRRRAWMLETSPLLER